MKIMQVIAKRTVVAAMALCVCGWTAAAFDLPIKKLGGREFYVYKVEKGESVYGITHKLGLTHNDIEKYNPAIVDGLKAGQTLYFPVNEFKDKFGAKNDTPTEVVVAEGDTYVVRKGDTLFSIAGRHGISVESLTAFNPGSEDGIKVGESLKIPARTQVEPLDGEREATLKPVVVPVVAEVPVESPNEKSVHASDTLNVVVCLPFMLEAEKADKSAGYATDFYKGFLLGLDSLSNKTCAMINVQAIDSDQPSQPFAALTKNKAVFQNADIVIAPDNLERLNELSNFGQSNQVYIFNSAQARDTTYLSNPYMIQGNMPQAEMMQKAIDFFMEELDGAVPVFLSNDKSTKDKQAFVSALIDRLKKESVDYKMLSFSNTLTSNALLEKLPTEGADYMFVPLSGSLNEFHKFATALSKYNTEVESAETPGRVRLFGYPDYTRFRGEAYDKLCNIGTSIYSRFYCDVQDDRYKQLDKSCVAWYGTSLPDGVPNQFVMGFDLANWIVNLATAAQLDSNSIREDVLDKGLQMSYKFNKIPEGGLVNDALYVVRFAAGKSPSIELR